MLSKGGVRRFRFCAALAFARARNLRRLGVRTREEIDRERYALKALAGDFEGVTRDGDNIDQTLATVGQ